MYTYKMYFSGDCECFEYDPWGSQGSAATQKRLPYLESLLSFLDLDLSGAQSRLQQIIESWENFFSSEDQSHADSAMQLLGALGSEHVYFQLLYLQWFERRLQGVLEPAMTEELRQLLAQLPTCQRQAQAFLERILDIDHAGRDVQLNLRRHYSVDRLDDSNLFSFEIIPVSFGPVDEDACGLVLHPNSVRDLIDFSLRDCIMRGIPVRRCRSCGRYFPLTGRVTAEYCSRPNPSRKPCRNTGAAQKWEESRRDDRIFKEYRREYKRRFAWIKAGKISDEEFAVWSRQARAKKAECESKKISLEEFIVWLKNL